MEKHNIDELIDRVAQGDPDRETVMRELYIELPKYFRNNPGIVLTKREQEAFIEGMRFYIHFDNIHMENAINKMETEIQSVNAEIEELKRRKP